MIWEIAIFILHEVLFCFYPGLVNALLRGF